MLAKPLLFVAGIASLSAGVVGVFLPILPTTPFLLLAAACFLRSSRRLYTWITRQKILGPYIENWTRYRAITLPAKIASIAVLWAVLASTILFAFSSPFMRVLLVLVGIGVTVHLLFLKTLTRDMREKQQA